MNCRQKKSIRDANGRTAALLNSGSVCELYDALKTSLMAIFCLRKIQEYVEGDAQDHTWIPYIIIE
jgi:hypothetical protein